MDVLGVPWKPVEKIVQKDMFSDEYDIDAWELKEELKEKECGK